MGQKSSSPSMSRAPSQSTYHHGNTLLYTHAPVSSRQQFPASSQQPRMGRDNSLEGSLSKGNVARLSKDYSNSKGVLSSSGSSLNSTVGNSVKVSQSKFQHASAVTRQTTVVPASKPVLATEMLQKSEPSVSVGRPVKVKNVVQKDEGIMTDKVDDWLNDLSRNMAKPLEKVDKCCIASEETPNVNVKTPSQDKNEATYLEPNKKLNVSSVYPDLSFIEMMCSERNCVKETSNIDNSQMDKVKDYKNNTNKTSKRSSFLNEPSNNRRQRIRNRTKPHIFNNSRNFRPIVTNSNSYPLNIEAVTADNVNEGKHSLETCEFNEIIVKKNANVVLKMLNVVSLETLSDSTKLTLKKLHARLCQLHGETASDKVGRNTFPDSEKGDDLEDDEGDEHTPNLQPEDFFQSLYSVNTRLPNNLSGAKLTNSKVQHVFGNIYFCSACEQDLHGHTAATEHKCSGSTALENDDAKSQSGQSDVAQTDTQTDVQHMWREVNRAQKGRWYNISHIKDGMFRCSTCGVDLDSAGDVIKHVRQNGHQQLLEQKRAEETEEDKIWRKIPRALKFNRKHFVNVERESSNVFICKICECEVLFTFNKLVSHLSDKSHSQNVRPSRKN